MTAATAEAQRPVGAEKFSTKLVRFLSNAPIQILLVVVGILWLVPTVGLFLTSLFSPTDINTLGWWEIFSKPSLATLDNYREIWHDQSIRSAFWTTVWISAARRKSRAR